jgi:hypothetical protein
MDRAAEQAESSLGLAGSNAANRRPCLGDELLLAFHRACDDRELEVADYILDVVKFMARLSSETTGDGSFQDGKKLVAADERLWQLRESQHPTHCLT